MADEEKPGSPEAIQKLAGIDRKLADLSELGKQMANANSPHEMEALQARFQALARAFARHVQELGAAVEAAKKEKSDKGPP